MIAVTGAGGVRGPVDARPHLRVPKNRKFMGVQDELAVVAAAQALERAGLLGRLPAPRTGLYLAVGAIPFTAEHADLLLRTSVDAEGGFSMDRFATEAMASLNPLLTFRCLSNMPAFHVSVNFDVQGPSLVTYPGPGQFYLALEEAACALAERRIDVALVGGVAHQRNFLVEHHFARVEPPIAPDGLDDAAGVLVLERMADAGSRARARLVELTIAYRPFHPFAESPAPRECLDGAALPDRALGPATLPVCVSGALGSALRHEIATRDGFTCRSAWGPA